MAKFKVGDKVRVKSLEWWKAQPKNEYGDVKCILLFSPDMTKYCGKEALIAEISRNKIMYKIDLDNSNLWWSEDMFEDEPIKDESKPSFFTKLAEAINKVVSENKQGITIEEKDGSIIITPIEDKEEDLPIGTLVACSNNTEYWTIGVYKGYKHISTRIDGKDGGECRNYIIPFDKFNPNDIEESLKYNVVK